MDFRFHHCLANRGLSVSRSFRRCEQMGRWSHICLESESAHGICFAGNNMVVCAWDGGSDNSLVCDSVIISSDVNQEYSPVDGYALIDSILKSHWDYVHV